MRVAGIDCGTNTIRLLIAQIPGADGTALTDYVRTMAVVRLGQGVDRTGKFAEAALERTLEKVREYGVLCRKYGVESLRFAATSATRDAENRQVFIDAVVQELGVEPQVLSGEQEASTSFSGAISAMNAGGLRAAASPMIAVDLGGGSTELVLGKADGTILGSYSMDVGSVRLRERRLHSNPPTEEEIAAARNDVRDYLDIAERHVDLGAARALIGLAGTVTTLTAKALELPDYQPERIHGAELSFAQIESVCEWFVHSTVAEHAELGFMAAGRADVIGAGAVVWQEVIRRIAQRTREAGYELSSAVTSEHDILDGLALWAARDPQAPQWKC
ncbi:MAG: exopolyphosphatase [Arcanobacterium sp.]|nr:exopolyphosphatase [Arcanobacterium sp.]MDY5588469.1 exopolyphosphatase [Arcanobacterium sp.]